MTFHRSRLSHPAPDRGDFRDPTARPRLAARWAVCSRTGAPVCNWHLVGAGQGPVPASLPDRLNALLARHAARHAALRAA